MRGQLLLLKLQKYHHLIQQKNLAKWNQLNSGLLHILHKVFLHIQHYVLAEMRKHVIVHLSAFQSFFLPNQNPLFKIYSASQPIWHKFYPIALRTASPNPAGLSATTIPAFLMASIFEPASPFPPATIAPA